MPCEVPALASSCETKHMPQHALWKIGSCVPLEHGPFHIASRMCWQILLSLSRSLSLFLDGWTDGLPRCCSMHTFDDWISAAVYLMAKQVLTEKMPSQKQPMVCKRNARQASAGFSFIWVPNTSQWQPVKNCETKARLGCHTPVASQTINNNDIECTMCNGRNIGRQK